MLRAATRTSRSSRPWPSGNAAVVRARRAHSTGRSQQCVAIHAQPARRKSVVRGEHNRHVPAVRDANKACKNVPTGDLSSVPLCAPLLPYPTQVPSPRVGNPIDMLAIRQRLAESIRKRKHATPFEDDVEAASMFGGGIVPDYIQDGL